MKNLTDLRQRLVLQVLISSTPAVFMLASAPYFVSALELPTALTGALFSVVFFGMISGTFLVPRLYRLFSAGAASAFTEFLSLVALGLVALALSFKLSQGAITLILISAYLLRGIAAGILGHIRTTWLKLASPNEQSSSEGVFLIKALTQGSYGIVGIAFYLLEMTPSISALMGLIAIDFITSILGIILFLRSPDRKIRLDTITQNIFNFSAHLIFKNRLFRNLFIVDLSVCIALGGTSIFMVNVSKMMGELDQFYPFLLILYSFSYFCGFLLKRWMTEFELKAGAVIGLGALALSLSGILYLGSGLEALFLGSGLALIAYAFLVLWFEVTWFKNLTKDTVSSITRTLLFAKLTVFGLCEAFYGLISTPISIRFLFACFALFWFVLTLGNKERAP